MKRLPSLSMRSCKMKSQHLLTAWLCLLLSVGKSDQESLTTNDGLTVYFTYIGCFVDSPTRDLNGLYGLTRLGSYGITDYGCAFNSATMTIAWCASVCALGNFSYFGVQAISECFCGFTYGSVGLEGNSADCSLTCPGNASTPQFCGGWWRNSVYGLTYPNNSARSSNCIRVRPSAMTTLTVSTTWAHPTYQAVGTTLPSCFMMCYGKCQAMVFSKQQKLCYLLRYRLIPEVLSSAVASGDFLYYLYY